jgi:two-component system CheB/CheR fusion protein
MTMAQDPESAKYPGMPRSAMATGLVDYVLPAGQLPHRLLAYAKGPCLAPSAPGQSADATLPEPMLKIASRRKSGAGHLCAPERLQGPAVHETRPHLPPQPAHLFEW